MNESNGIVSVGQKYRHFKTQNVYIVKDIAHNCENTNEKFVVYEGQYDSSEFGKNPVWIRNYKDFTGVKVFKDNELGEDGNRKDSVKRFTLID
jgi:hypothetical protein